MILKCHRVIACGVVFALSLVVATGAHAEADPAPRHPELRHVYEQFGGKQGLVALMDDFMIVLVEDPRTRRFFADSDQKRVKEKLVEQFCVILGGDCTYTGKGMHEAHTGLVIDEAAFNALVEDLQIAMQKHGIPFRAQNQLLRHLAPMHRDVINKP